jgi:hypothetical protein
MTLPQEERVATPWRNCIIPVGSTVAAVLRSLWYLRSLLLLLAGTLLVSALILNGIESGSGPSGGTQPPSSLAASLYLSVATACALGTGSLGAVSWLGKMLLLLDSVVGLVLLGVVVWVVQYCLGERSLRVSRLVLFASDKEAHL